MAYTSAKENGLTGSKRGKRICPNLWMNKGEGPGFCYFGWEAGGLNDLYRGQSFLAVVRFSSTPTPSLPLPSENCHFFLVILCIAGPAYCWERGEGEGVEPNHTTARKLIYLSSYLFISLRASLHFIYFFYDTLHWKKDDIYILKQ